MAKHIEHEVAYYYDFHPTEEDLMGETSVHATLVHYLIEVLTWLLEGQTCAVYENLNFYQTPNPTLWAWRNILPTIPTSPQLEEKLLAGSLAGNSTGENEPCERCL